MRFSDLGLHQEEPRSALSASRIASKQDVPMVELRRPTLDELRSAYSGNDNSELT